MARSRMMNGDEPAETPSPRTTIVGGRPPEEGQMISQKESAMSRFIATARRLWAEEPDAEKRWDMLVPLLRELLADPEIRAQSKEWPARAPTDPPENLLFTTMQSGVSLGVRGI